SIESFFLILILLIIKKLCTLFFFFFFFSSRRRHTRWPRDWSSDVCSSDLKRGRAGIGGAAVRLRDLSFTILPLAAADFEGAAERSEERRVGKECRSRWSR